MDIIKGKGLSLANGRSLEKAGKLSEAADIYQQMIDHEPLNQDALSRLVLVYRRLKEYRKELAAIDKVLAAYEEKDKTKQAAWLKAHPKAAGASRAILKELGGASATAFGVNPTVARLLKRRELVERRVAGGQGRTGKRKAVSKKKATPKRVVSKAPHPLKAIVNKGKLQAQRKAEAAERKRIAAEKESVRQEKQAAKEAEATSHPSLFVISLRYLVSLEKIDNMMEEHLAFLEKHYKSGNFIVSGRQVPRTGGIIIARGKNRDAVEKIVRQDPFVKRKYASFDIVEFLASRSADVLGRWLK